MNNTIILYCLIGVLALAVIILILMVVRLTGTVNKSDEKIDAGLNAYFNAADSRIEARFKQNEAKIDAYSTMVDTSIKGYGDLVTQAMSNMAARQDENLNNMAARQDERLKALDENFSRLRNENSKQMENIRQTVDEKLQTTLENKLTQSFSLVNERLEQVYKGLGEMQSIASEVGDLKKVLTNVKARGVLGEVQLEAILEEILTPDQYDKNVATKHNSNNMVEFAIRLPGDGDRPVYLPIDAKFPGDTYTKLNDAYEEGDKEKIGKCRKALCDRIEQEAKDISSKYIDPPFTTDFAIMFLPFEGLYAEVVRDGMIEVLQRKYKVSIAGPTTMAALLNSLQMGFNTLAIEKRSSEVWQLLAAVKTEFNTFAEVLENTQKKLTQANQDLDKLVGTRTRQIQRKLKDVTTLDEGEAKRLLED